MYLHYPLSLEEADAALERATTKWRRTERLYDMKKEQAKWKTHVPAPLAREIRRLHKECLDCERQVDTLDEVIVWHQDPQSLIEFYADSGYKLAYRVNNQEFETYEEALAEANFVHNYNDAVLEFGADGEGFDDLVDPEDMIQAVFVQEEF
jgi:hypothetical protein